MLVDFVFVTVPALTFFDAGVAERVGDGVADADGVVSEVGLADTADVADVAGAEGAGTEGASEAVVGAPPPQPEIPNTAATATPVISVRPRRRKVGTG